MGDRYYIRLEEKQKNKKLFDLLDTLEFNQAGSNKQIPSREANEKPDPNISQWDVGWT